MSFIAGMGKAITMSPEAHEALGAAVGESVASVFAASSRHPGVVRHPSVARPATSPTPIVETFDPSTEDVQAGIPGWVWLVGGVAAAITLGGKT